MKESKKLKLEPTELDLQSDTTAILFVINEKIAEIKHILSKQHSTENTQRLQQTFRLVNLLKLALHKTSDNKRGNDNDLEEAIKKMNREMTSLYYNVSKN